ncbi:hypothetical protein F4861DRAFT_538967 [Xylaria intraflava]|nr:hypothetical protein F4861DRAFT_538967 [Xylaria intraflava]
MFEELVKAARDPELFNSGLPLDVPEVLFRAIPDELSLDNLRELVLDTQYASDITAVLWAAYAVVKSRKLGTKLGSDGESKVVLEETVQRIGQMMEPVCSGASFDEDSTDYASLSRNGLLGLHIINLLLALVPQVDLALPTRTLLSVIAFTNRDDPWTTNACTELSNSLLSGYFQNRLAPRVVKQAPVSFPRFAQDVRADQAQPSENAPETEQARFITEDALTGFLRPIFAKSRPAAVTASGRPAAFPEPPPRYAQGDGFGGGANDITVVKSWKYTQQYTVTVFEWAVKNADTDLLQKHWPLYTPILLTLLDEPQPVPLKLRSLSIFRAFWSRCPEGLLSRIGLADVLEQAVFPTVLSLPSLTPEAESLALLGAAYPALFDMAGIRGSAISDEDAKGESTDDKATSDDPTPQSGGFSDAQRKLLDKVVREGLMVGYHHAKEHIKLVDFFCRTLRRLVYGMGILTVKYLKPVANPQIRPNELDFTAATTIVHLWFNSQRKKKKRRKSSSGAYSDKKDIIPMISETLTDPFGTKYPPALLSATHLLQAVLQTCWPRVPHYSNEIIKIAMLSWLNIEDEDIFPPNGPTKTELKQQLTRTVGMLAATMTAAKLDMSEQVSSLIAKNEQLRPLFAGYEVK